MDPDADDRQGLLRFPHMVPLENWRNTVAQGRPVPHFDPRDGGIDARLLILLETPGPGDAPVRFVSRDNAGGTQRNLARFLDAAGITRTDMLLWNCVPWIVHAPGARGRPLRRAEIREGLATLPGLLALLPRLTTVVLAGRVAREAAPVIAAARPNVALFTMPHPSPANVCTSPAVPAAIRDTLSAAAARLGSMYKEGVSLKGSKRRDMPPSSHSTIASGSAKATFSATTTVCPGALNLVTGTSSHRKLYKQIEMIADPIWTYVAIGG